MILDFCHVPWKRNGSKLIQKGTHQVLTSDATKWCAKYFFLWFECASKGCDWKWLESIKPSIWSQWIERWSPHSVVCSQASFLKKVWRFAETNIGCSLNWISLRWQLNYETKEMSTLDQQKKLFTKSIFDCIRIENLAACGFVLGKPTDSRGSTQSFWVFSPSLGARNTTRPDWAPNWRAWCRTSQA